jgi:hypothetical protein
MIGIAIWPVVVFLKFWTNKVRIGYFLVPESKKCSNFF